MKKIILAIIGSVAIVVGIVAINNNQVVIDQINQDLKVTPPAAGGTNYYVCDTGNDSNDGLSPTSPFKSYDKAMETFNLMFAGGSVLFCRGGVFPVISKKNLANNRCGATAVCTLADYGDKNKKRPLIAANDSAAISFADPGNADADGGYLVKNLILISTSHKGSGLAVFNDVDDLTLDNLQIEGFNVGINLSGMNKLNLGADQRNSRFILKNSTIINNNNQGFLGSCSDCLIENNQFINNGFLGGPVQHNLYLGSVKHGPASTNVIIRGNTLYRSAISPIDGKCHGTSLVVHGRVDNLLIDNNLIKEDKDAATMGCYGIAAVPGWPVEDESYHNLTIKNNKLVNVGGNAIGCASCVNVSIIDNIILDEDGGQIHYGISVPSAPENTEKSKNITIRGNNIILSHKKASGVYIGGENKFNVLNNIISQPISTIVDCIIRKGVNSNADISTNKCEKHTKISLVNKNTGLPIKNVSTIQSVEVSDAQTSTAQISTAQTSTARPSTARPSTAQTSTAQTSTARPSTAQTSTARPSTAQTSTARPSTARPSTAQTSTAQTSTARPSTARPSTARPSTAQTSTAQTSTARPSTAQTSTDKISSDRTLLGNSGSSSPSLGLVRYSDVISSGKTDVRSLKSDGACRASSSDGQCLLK